MEYREARPSAELAPHVRCFWLLSGVGPAGPLVGPAGPLVERVLPDGCPETVLHLGDAFRHERFDGFLEPQPSALLAGQLTRPLGLVPGRVVDVLAVRWRPGGAHAFLRRPMDELTDRITPLDDLVPGVDGLLDRLSACRDAADRLALLEGWLLQRIRAGGSREVGTRSAVRRIEASGGGVSVGDLAREAGISARSLQRRFRDEVGVGPKLLCRLVRFQRVLRALPASKGEGWAALAVRHGYSDQAHLIRDFRELAGETPARLARASGELSDLMTGTPTGAGAAPSLTGKRTPGAPRPHSSPR